MKDFLLVGCGSFVGGVLRYGVSLLMGSYSSSFPWATLGVNIVGCLCLGMLSKLMQGSPYVIFWTIGLCGGFTTFSTFSKETVALLSSGEYIYAVIYILISLVLGLLAVYLGSRLMAYV